MNHNEIRLEVLKTAYAVYQNPNLQNIAGGWGRPADFDDIDTDTPAVLLAVNYLIEKGYLELHRISNQMARDGIEIGITRITPTGIDFIEGPGPFYMPNIYTLMEDERLNDATSKEIDKLARNLRENPTPENINRLNVFLNAHAPWIFESAARIFKVFTGI